MNHILELVREHGDWFYLITFVWTALEGETFVIFAALAAQRGYLNLELLFVASWLGSFFGDQVFFLLGRRYGQRVVHHFPKLQPKLDKAFVWLEKYATAFILSYRFMYGIRNVSSLAIGLSPMSWRRFAFLNSLAAFLWALVFCGVGYGFGDVIGHLGRHSEELVNSSVHELGLAALGLFVLVLAIRMAFLAWQNGQKRLMRIGLLTIVIVALLAFVGQAAYDTERGAEFVAKVKNLVQKRGKKLNDEEINQMLDRP